MIMKEKLKITAILVVPIAVAFILFFGLLHIGDIFRSYSGNVAADDAGNIYIGFVGGMKDEGHIDVVDKDGKLLRRFEVKCGRRGYNFVLLSDKIYCSSRRGYYVVDLFGNEINEYPSEIVRSLLIIDSHRCVTSDGIYYIDSDLFGFKHVYRIKYGNKEVFY